MRVIWILLLFVGVRLCGVEVGVDCLFTKQFQHLVLGKQVGLITNHTGVTSSLKTTLHLFEEKHKAKKLFLKAIFAPEHGLYGEEYAENTVQDQKTSLGIPVFSLYGKSRRPSEVALEGIDVLVYDIQSVGTRVYTYETTLFYIMEAAAKKNIPVVVLDRPNPLGGDYVDGPMVDPSERSFVGYIDVPYCHGMTIGELALFFNGEYSVECDLSVVPMSGWHRSLRFFQTGLPWIPASPNFPEATTALFYPALGILGQFPSFTNIGVGFSLPFKIVVAPWIDGEKLARFLNRESFLGFSFHHIRIKPFFGGYRGEVCDGVLLVVTDIEKINPIRVQYWILDGLRQVYPKEFLAALKNIQKETRVYFDHVCGSARVYETLCKEKKPYWSLVSIDGEKRERFKKTRQKYLFKKYQK